MSKYALWGLKGLFTVLFAMIAISKLVQAPPLMGGLASLGYPSFLALLLGVAYALGLVGIWQRASAKVREWAFAGYSFALLGALASHILVGDPIAAWIPSAVLLGLLAVVYVLDNRRD